MTSNSPFFVPILGITAHDCSHVFLVFPLYSWHDNDTIIILQDRLKKMLASIAYKPSFSRMILSGLFSLLYVISLSLSLFNLTKSMNLLTDFESQSEKFCLSLLKDCNTTFELAIIKL